MKKFKGYFKALNPQKYDGDPTDIIFRSRLELGFYSFIDRCKEIVSWKSELIIVPYISPKDNKIHRYFPDILIRKNDKKGNLKTYLIEIKPESQIKPPKSSLKKKSRTYLNEMYTYAINTAKWEAADKYAYKRGWTFFVVGSVKDFCRTLELEY